mmetsp:Transcript_3425/g.6607  ORF Transcript_3425/g.6607 Transcript_3425/m.6607 type:complete len:294 (+) Transcript_3425:844-1725(+)
MTMRRNFFAALMCSSLSWPKVWPRSKNSSTLRAYFASNAATFISSSPCASPVLTLITPSNNGLSFGLDVQPPISLSLSLCLSPLHDPAARRTNSYLLCRGPSKLPRSRGVAPLEPVPFSASCAATTFHRSRPLARERAGREPNQSMLEFGIQIPRQSPPPKRSYAPQLQPTSSTASPTSSTSAVSPPAPTSAPTSACTSSARETEATITPATVLPAARCRLLACASALGGGGTPRPCPRQWQPQYVPGKSLAGPRRSPSSGINPSCSIQLHWQAPQRRFGGGCAFAAALAAGR